MVLMFVLAIMFLIIRANIISILLGGMVSHCSATHYQNVQACSAGILTVLSNCVGNVALLMAIA
jgi:NADH-ubiquinone oxidoreductase chain 5